MIDHGLVKTRHRSRIGNRVLVFIVKVVALVMHVPATPISVSIHHSLFKAAMSFLTVFRLREVKMDLYFL